MWPRLRNTTGATVSFKLLAPQIHVRSHSGAMVHRKQAVERAVGSAAAEAAERAAVAAKAAKGDAAAVREEALAAAREKVTKVAKGADFTSPEGGVMAMTRVSRAEYGTGAPGWCGTLCAPNTSARTRARLRRRLRRRLG